MANPAYERPDLPWQQYCEHIKHGRRFLLGGWEYGLDIPDPREWIGRAIKHVRTELKPGRRVWRAVRQHWSKDIEDQCKLERMWNLGSPPTSHARAGRASPEGIPVFYGALDPTTAILELRPRRGELIWLSRWRVAYPTATADLTRAAELVDPWQDGDLKELIDDHRLLQLLSSELSVPVSGDDNPIDYVPTQYASEMVRAAGNRAMVYRSSQNPDKGRNIAVFPPDVLPYWERETRSEPMTEGALDLTQDIRRVEITGVSAAVGEAYVLPPAAYHDDDDPLSAPERRADCS